MSFLCSLPVIAGLFGCPASADGAVAGYVEGDHVILAPTENAQLLSMTVKRGDHVMAGDVLAVLDDADVKIAVAESRAALAQAQAQLANLKEGRRPEEIAVLETALASAEAEAGEAGRVARRVSDLSRRGIAPQADLDQANTGVTLANARVAQAKANLAVARLPAREQEINAASEQVKRAEAALAAAEWRLSKRRIVASADGTISDVLRQPGDNAGPQAPVFDLLPEGATKIRLYFPQDQFSRLKPGTKLVVNCDGCEADIAAEVIYISGEPEFTPPVIYSIENRQKLVYLVEARETGSEQKLRPGQIVDGRIADAAE